MLREALTIVRKHKASIVIAKLDRLSRDIAFISSLMRKRSVSDVLRRSSWLAGVIKWASEVTKI